jgi:hypothetical protein
VYLTRIVAIQTVDKNIFTTRKGFAINAIAIIVNIMKNGLVQAVFKRRG